MPNPPPIINYGDHMLVPPHPRFASEGVTDGDIDNLRSHSRNTSGAMSNTESPPLSPRSLTFGNSVNPFSPPASVVSFSPAHTPSGSLIVPHNHYPFPEPTHRSGVNSVSTSVADLTRNSSSFYGSRPNTGDYSTQSRPSSTRFREAFASPRTRPLTMYSSVQNSSVKIQRERPKSTMLTSETAPQKPWIQTRDPHMRVAYWLTYGVMLIGIIAGGVRCYFGWRGVKLISGNLCLVMDENFDSEEGVFGDNGKFFREVDMSGFGNGEFEMTTTSSNNSFVRNGHLYISPTLTSDVLGEAAIVDGAVYNITDCTFNVTKGVTYTASSKYQPANMSAIGMDQDFDVAGYTRACSAVSNATTGQIINPVQSARLSTRLSASIRYGRVDVRAKIPTGDWMWPAIWMLPVDNAYGGWPMSGEIDIMEARGNGPKYTTQGSNFVRGTLNWGPTQALNAAFRTSGWWSLRRGSYDQDFHTYTLEWDEDFIRISVDSRLHHILDLRVKQSFWTLGKFPLMVQNGSETVALENIWVNGTKAAPFDQKFYLILDVGVGGTNGWFPDGTGKPWFDSSLTAMGDFWRAKDQWLPTWPTDVEKRSMVVDYVKMWQKC